MAEAVKWKHRRPVDEYPEWRAVSNGIAITVQGDTKTGYHVHLASFAWMWNTDIPTKRLRDAQALGLKIAERLMGVY